MMVICDQKLFGLKENKTMWTLILTIIMAGGGVHSEITTIPGFETKQQCIDAGKQWYKDVSEKLKPYTEVRLGRQYIFTCVKVK